MWMEAEPAVRLGAFLGVLLLMALWEGAAPRRRRSIPRRRRWPSNLGIVVLNAGLVRFLVPLPLLGIAWMAEQERVGLLYALSIPAWAGVPLAVVLLDLVIYLQHVLFHTVPALWRLHRMHHADLELDVTTGVRFHPLEILLSLGLKSAAVLAIGAPAVAVILFEVVLNASSMFNHANVRLPGWLDRGLRWIVVTPDMHRVHHSIRREETDSNFGFNLSWWDRLLGTYRPQPKDGHEGMTIGIEQFRTLEDLSLPRMLVQPIRGGIRTRDE